MSDSRKKDRSHIRAQPPEALGKIELTKPKAFAAGIAAIKSSIIHLQKELGIFAGLKTMSRVNQIDGVDCPGCAWPDPEDRSKLGEYCENGAKAVAEEATSKRIDEEYFATHSLAELSHKSDYELGKLGRLTQPMYLGENASHYLPISWVEAFSIIGSELKDLLTPDEAIFYTSGRTSNEAAYMYQLFARLFGTNNLPDCSNMCHESSGMGMTEVLGIGKGTVSMEDFELSEVIIVIGQNPGTNHPRMLATLEKAKEKGAKIIHINPLAEAGLQRFKNPQKLKGLFGQGTALADLFLQVRINGDVALLKGIMKEIVEIDALKPGEKVAYNFIQEMTENSKPFVDDLKAESWDVIVEESGVSREKISEAVQIILDKSKIIVCWAMGLTQHENAIANIQSVVNLLLLKGSFGKPGAGACPVRGHSNVQGDRTMGITPRPSKSFLDYLARAFEFEPPQEHGLDTVESIHAMHEGRAKVFIGLGGNFISATPDTEYTAQAMRRCRLSVQISTKLNRSHLVTGKQALILPCLSRTEMDVQASGEQFVSVENSMGIVHQSRGTRPPASADLLSEPQIIAGIAEATLGDQGKVPWKSWADNYNKIRDAIEFTVVGFPRYNYEIRQESGFVLPNIVREGGFGTPSGKAKFTVHPIPRQNLKLGEFIMMTIRSHDQFNTTVYGLEDRYRGIKGERRVVLMNPEDIKESGLRSKAVVDLVSHFQDQERIARRFYVVPYDLPRKCIATYFPEANALIPIDKTAVGSNTPSSKSVLVTLIG